VLLGILGETILDNRFLRLIEQMLKAGYIEDWEWNATLSGARAADKVVLTVQMVFHGSPVVPAFTASLCSCGAGRGRCSRFWLLSVPDGLADGAREGRAAVTCRDWFRGSSVTPMPGQRGPG
jgi:hypothetical protein